MQRPNLFYFRHRFDEAIQRRLRAAGKHENSGTQRMNVTGFAKLSVLHRGEKITKPTKFAAKIGVKLIEEHQRHDTRERLIAHQMEGGDQVIEFGELRK